MIFSQRCRDYLDVSSCGAEHEKLTLDLIIRNLPIGASSINWSAVADQIEVPKVSHEGFSNSLQAILQAMDVSSHEVFTVININDAFPALETTMADWLRFSDELDYVDTLFFCQEKKLLVHWDFYRDLHAVSCG